MTQPVQLNRSLPLTLVTFYGIGTILGAGIYVLVGKVGGVAGMQAPLAFLLASILAAFSAFSYAELASRFPRSAGEAIYVEQGLGSPRFARLVGLLIVFVGVVSTATLIHGFKGYLTHYVAWPDALVMTALTLCMGAIVAWGISQSVMIASVMTVVEVVGLVIIIWVARDSFGQLPARLPELLPSLDWNISYGILLGAFIAFYAFIGFEDIVNIAEEVIRPSVNIPRAIMLALIITSVFYILVAVVSILSVPPQQLGQSEKPLALVYRQVTGQEPDVIVWISLFSVLNGAIIQMIMASRVLYGMSRQNWLPAQLGYVHPVTRTPLIATALVTGLILVFALWLPLLSLAKLTSFVTLTIFTVINLALWRIKLKQPAAPQVFSVPLWVPVTGFFMSLAFVLFQIIAGFDG